jgi:hypothetical protein
MKIRKNCKLKIFQEIKYDLFKIPQRTLKVENWNLLLLYINQFTTYLWKLDSLLKQ